MVQINLDHWFIKNNELSISLIRYYVSIELVFSENDINALLMVTKGEGENRHYLSFLSLEDAIIFTEDVINKCNNIDEIINIYSEEYSQKCQKNLCKKKI